MRTASPARAPPSPSSRCIAKPPPRRSTASTRGGGRAIALSGDVANEADVAGAVAETVAELGRLDVMVNNAGTIEISPFVEQTLDGWDAACRP